MRLIYITSSLPYGPGEAFIIPEIQELKRLGHEVMLVPMYPRGTVFHEKAMSLMPYTFTQSLLSWKIIKATLQILMRTPLKTFMLLVLLFRSRTWRIFLKNLAVFPKALWLASLARHLHAEHIHAHWAATTATMTMVAGGLAGVPWSITAHRWDIAENNLIAQKARRAAFIRAIDRRGAQGLAAFANWGKWEAHVIHMGVALPPVSRHANSSSGTDSFRIIMAANFVKIKGHQYLVEAARILRDKGMPLQIDLLGGGPLQDAIKREVKCYQLEERVKFIGPVPHEQLIAQLQAGVWHLMVLPSIEDQAGEREGIPVALMEAMACGIPVVSTNTGGIPELLEDGAGLMVPPKDPLALAGAIERLANEPVLRKQLAEAGRLRVQERFSLEKVVGDLATRFITFKGANG